MDFENVPHLREEAYRGNNGFRKQMNFALRFLQRLPLDLKYKILAETGLPYITHFIHSKNPKLQHRFELACRENQIPPIRGQNTPWISEFARFVRNLKIVAISNLPEANLQTSEEIGITGRKLWLRDHRLNSSNVQITFENPRQFRPNIRRDTKLLSFARTHATLAVQITLGNRHDLAVEGYNERLVTVIQTKDSGSTSLSFDMEDRAYWFQTDTAPEMTNFYRKSLTTNDEQELIWTLEDEKVWGIAVGDAKMFALTTNGPAFDASRCNLTCFDMRRRRTWRTSADGIDASFGFMAHGNSVVYSNGNQGLTIQKIEDGKFIKRQIACYRRRFLNKDTYLILVDLDQEKVELRTLSLVDDEPIERFVQQCEKNCFFHRLRNNFFYVLETSRRYFWYQETPGGTPYLLHSDSQRTTVDLNREWDD